MDDSNYEADLVDKIFDVGKRLQSSIDMFQILTNGEEDMDFMDFDVLLSTYSTLCGLVPLLKVYNSHFEESGFKDMELSYETNLNKLKDLLRGRINKLFNIKTEYENLIKYLKENTGK